VTIIINMNIIIIILITMSEWQWHGQACGMAIIDHHHYES